MPTEENTPHQSNWTMKALVIGIAAVVAVLITVLCIRRYRASKEEDADEDKAVLVDNAGNQMRRSEHDSEER